MGSKLFVRLGRPEEIVPAVVRRLGAKDVYCQDETTRADFQVASIGYGVSGETVEEHRCSDL